jgi:hypothetical protein
VTVLSTVCVGCAVTAPLPDPKRRKNGGKLSFDSQCLLLLVLSGTAVGGMLLAAKGKHTRKCCPALPWLYLAAEHWNSTA